MAEATTQGGPLLTYVQIFQELHLGRPLVEIDGVAMIQMVMVGQIKEIDSLMNQPSGEI